MTPTEFYIMGESIKFSSMNQAKKSVYLNYSEDRRKELNGNFIIGYNKPCETIVSMTEIHVNESGKYRFSKTKKMC